MYNYAITCYTSIMENVKKKQVNIRLEQNTIKRIQKMAKKQKRSFTNMVETMLDQQLEAEKWNIIK